MYKLKESTKRMASMTLKMDNDEFIKLDYDDEINYINSLHNTKCSFESNQTSNNSFLTIEDVDKGLEQFIQA